MTDIIYTWDFPSKKQRWSTWYIITISIVIWLVIWWFLTKQYWMSFIIILITWLVFFVENNSEDNTKVEINELWIKIWDSFYDFSKISSYTLIYSQDNAILLRLNLNKSWIKVIDLIIDNNIAINLKNILPNYIEENPEWELSLTEKLISILKL